LCKPDAHAGNNFVTGHPPRFGSLLITLGPGIALLPLLEKAKGRVAQWVLVYGRVPMFYYILHVFLRRRCAFYQQSS
jgi:uncharacterized membrane protein